MCISGAAPTLQASSLTSKLQPWVEGEDTRTLALLESSMIPDQKKNAAPSNPFSAKLHPRANHDDSSSCNLGESLCHASTVSGWCTVSHFLLVLPLGAVIVPIL